MRIICSEDPKGNGCFWLKAKEQKLICGHKLQKHLLGSTSVPTSSRTTFLPIFSVKASNWLTRVSLKSSLMFFFTVSTALTLNFTGFSAAPGTAEEAAPFTKSSLRAATGLLIPLLTPAAPAFLECTLLCCTGTKNCFCCSSLFCQKVLWFKSTFDDDDDDDLSNIEKAPMNSLVSAIDFLFSFLLSLWKQKLNKLQELSRDVLSEAGFWQNKLCVGMSYVFITIYKENWVNWSSHRPHVFQIFICLPFLLFWFAFYVFMKHFLLLFWFIYFSESNTSFPGFRVKHAVAIEQKIIGRQRESWGFGLIGESIIYKCVFLFFFPCKDIKCPCLVQKWQ